MDLYDSNNMMLIAPDGKGGWTVNSRGELEGWIRRSGEQLEFAHTSMLLKPGTRQELPFPRCGISSSLIIEIRTRQDENSINKPSG